MKSSICRHGRNADAQSSGKIQRLLCTVGVVASACLAYDDSTPPPGPPCIDVAEGARFSVQLVEPYDASSNSLFDAQQIPDVIATPTHSSCQAQDGLGNGSVFEFTTDRYSPAYYSGPQSCSYREMEFVSGVGVGAGHYDSAVAGAWGKSFAGWTRIARLAGQPVLYRLLVFALSGSPYGAVIPRALPPAIVIRQMNDCIDVWVATVQEVKP